MPSLGRCIRIPGRHPVLYIMSRILRIIRCREVGMQLSEVRTVVSRLAEHVADTLRILAQRTDRTLRVTVQGHPAPVRIHPRKQHSAVRTTQRTVAHGRAQHHRLTREPVQIRRMYRVVHPVDMLLKPILPPERQCLIAELVGKYINHIRKLLWCSLQSHTFRNAQQGHSSHYIT